MAIVPLGNRILIEQVKETNLATDSGIILGEERAPQSIKAKVLAVGGECGKRPELGRKLEPNDVLIVSQYSPTEARERPSDRTLIASEDDVLAVVTK